MGLFSVDPVQYFGEYFLRFGRAMDFGNEFYLYFVGVIGDRSIGVSKVTEHNMIIPVVVVI